MCGLRFTGCSVPSKPVHSIVRLLWSALAVSSIACSERAPVAGVSDSTIGACDPHDCALSDTTVSQLAEAFLLDCTFRRVTLQESLLVTSNAYAQERLTNYAQPTGWDSLPVFNPPVAELRVDEQGSVSTGEYAKTLAEAPSSEFTAWTVGQWEELGRRAFHAYPAQHSPLLEREVSVGEATDPTRIAALGVWQSSTRTLGGLTSTRYPDGSTGVALTCASCHARPDDTQAVIDGPPSNINLTAFSEDISWGPGKVDVTADELDNPVAIADLRATRSQRRLHHSGNLANGLGALVVRIETLLTSNLNAAVRPPREVAFALGVYVWRLGERQRDNLLGRSVAARNHTEGAEVFERRCQTCHDGEWGEGAWVPVDAVGTEPLVAQSPARGSGGYRVPALVGFGARKLSHEALSGGVDVWLGGAEPRTGDSRMGHAEATGGSPLDVRERAALVEFLQAAFDAPY